MAEIVWAPRAIADLESLAEYISRDSPVNASRFVSRLLQRVESLGTQPDSGSFLQEDENLRYRQVFQGMYRVIYRYDDETVWIVAVHHAARLLTSEDLQS